MINYATVVGIKPYRDAWEELTERSCCIDIQSAIQCAGILAAREIVSRKWNETYKEVVGLACTSDTKPDMSTAATGLKLVPRHLGTPIGKELKPMPEKFMISDGDNGVEPTWGKLVTPTLKHYRAIGRFAIPPWA